MHIVLPYGEPTDATLATSHSPSGAQIIGRPIQSDPGSEESISMIQDWVQECNASHSSCYQDVETKLPTRVIDVGPSDKLFEPRLITSDGRSGQYVALTHVWGGLVPVRTLIENLAKHMSRLPLSSLPPNFRDAVIITRRLGMRYLWIDALCIIQDSIQDWEVECARMGDIYKSSTLTIAAVDAENSRTGFLNTRLSSISNPPSCQLPCLGSSGCKGARIEALRRDPQNSLDKNSPLSLRAWCMQEKLLCPRILYFGKKQTYWDCNTLSHLEAYGSAPPENKLYSGLDFGKASYNVEINRLRKKMKYPDYRLWIRFIHEYSERNLTKLEDKLPALSGLAADFQKLTGFTYLAGVWKEDLHQGLTWAVEQPQRQPSGQPNIPYIAPSWSWASHVGPVNFTHPIEYMDAEVQDARTTLAGLDPFGRVTSGYLQIRGRAKFAIVRYQEKSEIPDFTFVNHLRQSLFDAETGQEIGRCSFDYVDHAVFQTRDALMPSFSDEIDKLQKKVFCLALVRQAMSPTVFRSTIMVLERDKTTIASFEGKWNRIGIGYMQYPTSIEGLRGKDWFADLQDQELLIV